MFKTLRAKVFVTIGSVALLVASTLIFNFRTYDRVSEDSLGANVAARQLARIHEANLELAEVVRSGREPQQLFNTLGQLRSDARVQLEGGETELFGKPVAVPASSGSDFAARQREVMDGLDELETRMRATVASAEGVEREFRNAENAFGPWMAEIARVSRELEKLDEGEDYLELLPDLKRRTLGLRSEIYKLVVVTDEEEVEQSVLAIQVAGEKIRAILAAFEKGSEDLELDPIEGDAAVAAVKAAGEAFEALAKSIAAFRAEGTALAESKSQVAALLPGLLETQTAQVEAAVASSSKRMAESEWLMAALIAGALVLLVVTLAIFLTSVIRPVEQVADALAQLAGGESDLTRRLEEKRDDEIGRVARGFNTFVERIRSTVSEVDEQARGLTQNALSMKHESERLDQEIGEMSTKIDTLATSARGVDEDTQQAASGFSHLDEAVNGVATKSQDAMRVTEGAVTRAHEAVSSIESLQESITGIAEVLAMINEISEQTNLLALNATIEAARAGEVGKGFAVVANEVKELSKRTAEATGNIQEIVASVQQNSKEATRAMTETRDIITNVNQLTDQISSDITEQTQTSQEIRGRVEAVSRGNDSIDAASSALASRSTTVTEVSHEVTTASSDVKRRAEAIQNLTSSFRC